ncbi:MAG: hypothetical protein KJ053_05080 [Dehalococcoidia bacterium]|nr:hypothetical protein [Dehalococcoidia bacterium]
MNALRREDGQALVMVAVMMVGLVSVVGLVSDGGLVFAQRRDLQNAADAAAAAAAMQIDEDAYRATGDVVLDERWAHETAARYLAAEDGVSYEILTSPDSVEVSVSQQASTSFLGLIGIDDMGVSARASAEPRYGVDAAGP